MPPHTPIHRFGKDLTTGSYDLIVLDVLREGPAYGYEIRRRIFTQSRGTIAWQSGTLYRVLGDLERRGLVRSAWQGRRHGRQRHYYRLTSAGQRAWREQRAQWAQFSRAVNALLGL
jgi:DNA-binding PadR family transcriptional regulator